jgi:hypothetical protein
MKTNWESKTSRKLEGGVAIKQHAAAEGFVGEIHNSEKEQMNKTKSRCLSLALVIGVLALFGSAVAVAQPTHGTGLTVTKTCPDPTLPVAQGQAYQCAFVVTNSGDIDHGVANLVVTNSFPWIAPGDPGNGTPVAAPCMQGGVAVTTLGIAGSGTATCTGTVNETAPNDCNLQARQVNDRIAVTGNDAGGTLGPVSGSATNGPVVSPAQCDDGLFCTDDACTPGVGCTTTTHPCADTSLCTTDSCDETANACLFDPVVCSDGDLCTTDACDPASGSPTACLTTPVVCDDGDFCTLDACDPATGSTTACLTEPNPDLSCADIEGRMTGGGSVFSGVARTTHGFELHCDELDLPNNLEVNWGRGNRFHLEQLTSAICTEDPEIDQTPPGHSPFDTFIGEGIGRCNGVSGAAITFTFVDAGEPGKNDTATIEITGCPDGLALSVSGNLKKGNHQAHRTTPQ